MSEKVYSVESIRFSLNKAKPPQLIVQAIGTVPTSGWSNGRLEPVLHVEKPADGIQEFKFVATPPQSIVLQVLTPIEGIGGIPLQDWTIGIRVLALSNSREIAISDKNCFVEHYIAKDRDENVIV